jgi:NAD(P)-dependent dehydrogenase (short-subunit alcohol dehydrogenase family)
MTDNGPRADAVMKDGRVTGKVAVVTGAASGIGRASVELLAQEGASVVVADIDGDKAEEVASAIEHSGGRARAVAVDVSDPAQVHRLMDTAVTELGGLDIVHNNAILSGAAAVGSDRPVADLDLDAWRRTLSVSLDGHLLGCRFALPHMIAGGGGSIVNTASAGAWAGDRGDTAATAAAGAIVSLTRSVATQYGKQGIRCNAVSPGIILTPAATARWSPHELDVLGQSNLLPRHGHPVDVANAVLFLASDEASFVTGLTIRVDGGHLAHLPHYAHLMATGGTTTGPQQGPTEKAEVQ